LAVGVPTRDYKKKSMGRWRNRFEIEFLKQFDFPKSNKILLEEFGTREGMQRQRGVETVSSEEVF